MAPRGTLGTLSWLLTAALAVGGFVGGHALAAASRSDSTVVVPTPPRPRIVPIAGAAPVQPSTPAPAAPPLPTRPPSDPGADLYLQVNDEYPEEGPRTWAAIHNATQHLAEQYFKAEGSPATRCAPDGTLDFVPLHVQWSVSSRVDGVQVNGGRVIDADLPPDALRCLNDYFGKITGTAPNDAPLVELDILYEFPAAYAGTSARALGTEIP